jgi:hypothetical protein
MTSQIQGFIERAVRVRRSSGQGDERLGIVLAEPEEVSAVLAAQVQEVLESGGPDEHRPRTTPLEERVRCDRRAVREALDRVRPEGAVSFEHRLLLRGFCVGTYAVLRRPSSTRTAAVNLPYVDPEHCHRPSSQTRPALKIAL